MVSLKAFLQRTAHCKHTRADDGMINDSEAADTETEEYPDTTESHDGSEVDEEATVDSFKVFCNERYGPAFRTVPPRLPSMVITGLTILWATFHVVLEEDHCATPISYVDAWKEFPGALTRKVEIDLSARRLVGSIYVPVILMLIFGRMVEFAHGSFKSALLVVFCLLGGSLFQALVASPCSFLAYSQSSGAWPTAVVVQGIIA